MPKKVDHDQRREELLEAVSRVIARRGVDGATMREIAQESGWSTGLLAHYFSDRDDIIASALRYSHQVTKRRYERKIKVSDSVKALRALILDNLPLDKTRMSETRLEIVFWGQALNSHDLLEVQRTEAEKLYNLLVTLIVQAQQAGRLTSQQDPELVAERFLALIDGLSLHKILYGPRLSRARMIEIIDQELAALESGPGPTGEQNLGN